MNKTVGIFIVVFVLLGITVGVLRLTPFRQKVSLPSKEEKAKQETKTLVEKIGELMDLPKDEEPVMATVQDKDLLIKEQKFFAGAENGDILLIFPKAAKAIIYSPKRNILVNAGPLVAGSGIQPTQPKAGPQDTDTPPSVPLEVNMLTVEIRNGTNINGLANIFKDSLSANELFEVTTVSDAAKKDYRNTIIIDTGRTENDSALYSLSQVLGAQTITAMPEGERLSSADVVVILGEDKAKN